MLALSSEKNLNDVIPSPNPYRKSTKSSNALGLFDASSSSSSFATRRCVEHRNPKTRNSKINSKDDFYSRPSPIWHL